MNKPLSNSKIVKALKDNNDIVRALLLEINWRKNTSTWLY